MDFEITEFLGQEVVVELFDGERVCGVFVPTQTPDFICLRAGAVDAPYLINQRYIKMLFLKPEDSNGDTD